MKPGSSVASPRSITRAPGGAEPPTAHDLVTLYHDDRAVLECRAGAVEHVGGLEDDGLRGCCRRGRGGRGGGDEQRGGHSQERGKARRAGVSGLRHEYVRCVGVAQSRGSVRRGAMPPAHVPATGVLRI